MSRRYTGEDALAYQEGPQDAAGPINYVQKRLQKRKGIEVVFDPKGQKYAHCAAEAESTYVSTSVCIVQGLLDRFSPTEAETQKRSCKVSQPAHSLGCVGWIVTCTVHMSGVYVSCCVAGK